MKDSGLLDVKLICLGSPIECGKTNKTNGNPFFRQVVKQEENEKRALLGPLGPIRRSAGKKSYGNGSANNISNAEKASTAERNRERPMKMNYRPRVSGIAKDPKKLKNVLNAHRSKTGFCQSLEKCRLAFDVAHYTF